MNEIFKMAQKVATNIAEQNSGEMAPEMDMSKLISQVTSSVSNMVTPDFIEKMGGADLNLQNNNINDLFKNSEVDTVKDVNKTKKQSKINLTESSIEDTIEDSNEESKKILKTKDLHFTLNVTLEELYTGKQKKLAIRRKKIITSGKKKAITEEKKKLTIDIEPGMYDEQTIIFNNLADEKPGYETGDIIITLCCSEHDVYERENDNLLIEKEISLYEIYNCNMTLKHLNGEILNITSTPINVFEDDELESYRKIKGKGMPIIYDEEEKLEEEKLEEEKPEEEKPKFGDLIIKFTPKLPNNLTDEQLDILKTMFPKINDEHIEDKEIHQLELVTESDFEYSDSEEYDSDYDSEEYDSDCSNNSVLHDDSDN